MFVAMSTETTGQPPSTTLLDCGAQATVHVYKEKVALPFHVLQLDLVDTAQLLVSVSASVSPVMFKLDFLENDARDSNGNHDMRVLVTWAAPSLLHSTFKFFHFYYCHTSIRFCVNENAGMPQQ